MEQLNSETRSDGIRNSISTPPTCSSINLLLDVAEARGKVCDSGMRLLSAQRKDHVETSGGMVGFQEAATRFAMTASFYNLCYAAISVNFIKKAVLSGFDAKNFDAIAPYLAQIHVYEQAFRRLHKENPNVGYNLRAAVVGWLPRSSRFELSKEESGYCLAANCASLTYSIIIVFGQNGFYKHAIRHSKTFLPGGSASLFFASEKGQLQDGDLRMALTQYSLLAQVRIRRAMLIYLYRGELLTRDIPLRTSV